MSKTIPETPEVTLPMPEISITQSIEMSSLTKPLETARQTTRPLCKMPSTPMVMVAIDTRMK